MADILSECSTPQSASALCDALVRIASDVFAQARISIWLRDRLTGAHMPFDTQAVARFAGWELPTPPQPGPAALDRAQNELSSPRDVRGALQPEQGAKRPRPAMAQRGIVRQAMRGVSCVGLLVIEEQNGEQVQEQAGGKMQGLAGDGAQERARVQGLDDRDPLVGDICQSICDAMVVAYDREHVHKLLQIPQINLDFRGSPQEFYDSLAAHVARSARMRFVAIRELDQASSSLVTLAVYGLNDRDLSRYDLHALERFPSFQAALEGETVALSNTQGSEIRALHEIEELRDVRSFMVAPLQTKGASVGVVSGASDHAYEYSGTETLGFMNLARHVSVSLSYFRSAQTQREQLIELTETAAAFTGIEVAAAVRHDAKLKVANVTSRIDNIGTAFKQGKPAVGHERLKKLKHDANDLYSSLDQLKLITVPPNRTSELIGLHALIKEAMSAASANFTQRGISQPTVTGPNTQVLVYRDWLRQVIVNLLLNSLDAYGPRRASQSSREIAIRIDGVPAKATKVQFQYSDNAGGLQPHKLSRSDDTPILDAEAAIFEKGVTSKKTGTGYGLWLARSIMTEHGGSINLVDHRGGMTFSLELPVPAVSPLPPPKKSYAEATPAAHRGADTAPSFSPTPPQHRLQPPLTPSIG